MVETCCYDENCSWTLAAWTDGVAGANAAEAYMYFLMTNGPKGLVCEAPDGYRDAAAMLSG